MTIDEIISTARSDFLDDATAPYLWPDATLVRYVNEAEREACRRASLLVDKTTATDAAAAPLCELSVVAGTATYTVSSKILRIRDAIPASNGIALVQRTEGWLDKFYPEWRSATGTPIYFVQDKQIIRLVPEPVATDTLTLEVVRLPLADMALAQNPADSPEISSEYHFDLVYWICHLAYLKQDAETENFARSQLYDGKFMQRFGPPLSAITESNRRRRPRNTSLQPKEFGFQ